MSILKYFTPRLLALLAFSLMFFSACEKDDDEDPDNESELITTVTLTFTNTANGQTVTASFTDPDGVGGVAPTVQPIALMAGATYNFSVKFFDASNPADIEDITEEVEEEDEEHLVCYTVSGAMPAPTNLNTDGKGQTLGTSGRVSPTTAGSGTISVSLKHEPTKGGANACSTGETDVETTPAFPVTIN